MNHQRRVVVTGIGLMTPCGEGWRPFWQSMLSGQSHIRTLTQLSLNGFPSKYGGEITGLDPQKIIKNRKSLKVMSKTILLAVMASQHALNDSGICLEETNRDRFGVSLGTGIINNDLDELASGIGEALSEQGVFDIRKFGQSGIRALFPLWFLKYLPNMPACHISITHGLKGPSNTITTSSAAGTQAIGEAFHVIARGDADLMLAGSSDSKINAMGISRLHLLGLLSQRNHGTSFYAPFDESHDGMVLGEGAGLVVLEELEHARRRGATIYGEVTGYGSSSDFNYDPRLLQDYTGKCLAMKRALSQARLHPSDVDVVVAHGSGIPKEDEQEALAIHEVFNSSLQRTRVTAVKPITGHLVYGAGGVEFAAGMLVLKEKSIPRIANFKRPAPNCDLPFPKETEKKEVKSILVNACGFGGQNASLAVRHYA